MVHAVDESTKWVVEMIKSCPYCMNQTHLCPRCEGPVLLRNIVVVDNKNRSHSTSLILCDNLDCQNYGEFKQQTVNSIVTEVCQNEDCQRQLKEQQDASTSPLNDGTGYSHTV
jgi:hypothetical protein